MQKYISQVIFQSEIQHRSFWGLNWQYTVFTLFGNFSMDSKMNAVKMETGKCWVHLTADPLKIQFNAFVHEKKNNY